MSYEFKETDTESVFNDPLFDDMQKAYRLEVGHKDYLDGVLNKDFYRNAVDRGDGVAFSLRHNGELVGFFFIVLMNVPHSTMLSATVESFYIAPGHRGYARQALTKLANAAYRHGAPGILVSGPVGSRMDRWMRALRNEPAYVGYYIKGSSGE